MAMSEPDPVGGVCAEVGEAPVLAAVNAFYRRIAVDDLLAPLYPEEDLGPAEMRLADFLVGRFGGSDRYVQSRGHPRLRMRHAPFPVDRVARDRWMELMTAALIETDFPEPARTRVLAFLDGVATFLVNR
jgi:hemoglobin